MWYIYHIISSNIYLLIQCDSSTNYDAVVTLYPRPTVTDDLRPETPRLTLLWLLLVYSRVRPLTSARLCVLRPLSGYEFKLHTCYCSLVTIVLQYRLLLGAV